MLIVLCPQCQVELDHDVEDVGYLVECPACLKQFVATTDRTGEALISTQKLVSERPSEEPVLMVEEPTPSLPQPPLPETLETVKVECRVCLGTVTVAKADIGYRVECPLCQAMFLATALAWKKPSRRSRSEDDVDDEEEDDEHNLTARELRKKRQEEQDEFNPKRMLRNAKADLSSMAGAIHVLGWIDLITGIVSIFVGIAFLLILSNAPAGARVTIWVYLNVCIGIGGILLGSLKIVGGTAMKNLKSRNMALMGCWASLLPLNLGTCISLIMFPTYFVSLVFGILGLIAMSKPSVKRAFEFNKPDGDMDAA